MTTGNNTTKLLSVSDVAEILCVSVTTVRRLVYDGAITCYKIRGNLRFTGQDVDSFLTEQRIKPVRLT